MIAYYELIGAASGITGAMMLATKTKHAAWAWPIWVISSVAWMLYAAQTQAYGLLAQQSVFCAINLLGVWRWLGRQSTESTHRPANRDA